MLPFGREALPAGPRRPCAALRCCCGAGAVAGRPSRRHRRPRCSPAVWGGGGHHSTPGRAELGRRRPVRPRHTIHRHTHTHTTAAPTDTPHAHRRRGRPTAAAVWMAAWQADVHRPSLRNKRTPEYLIKITFYSALTLLCNSALTVFLAGADYAPPPRDLGNNWADFDAKEVIRRAVT